MSIDDARPLVILRHATSAASAQLNAEFAVVEQHAESGCERFGAAGRKMKTGFAVDYAVSETARA